eukprot:COSAG01_NODE_603_length_14905_cov_12.534648_3_plen_193_part_00
MGRGCLTSSSDVPTSRKHTLAAPTPETEPPAPATPLPPSGAGAVGGVGCCAAARALSVAAGGANPGNRSAPPPDILHAAPAPVLLPGSAVLASVGVLRVLGHLLCDRVAGAGEQRADGFAAGTAPHRGSRGPRAWSRHGPRCLVSLARRGSMRWVERPCVPATRVRRGAGCADVRVRGCLSTVTSQPRVSHE